MTNKITIDLDDLGLPLAYSLADNINILQELLTQHGLTAEHHAAVFNAVTLLQGIRKSATAQTASEALYRYLD